MNKKAIAILGAIFLLIVGTLGFLVYAKYHNNSSNKVVSTNPTPSPTPAPQPAPEPQPTTPVATSTPTPTPPPATTTPASSFVKLSSDQVISPALFFNGQGVTYFNNQGQLFTADLTDNGTSLQLDRVKSLDIKVKGGFNKVLWAPKGPYKDDFILEFDRGSQRTWSLFDASVGDYVDFPPQITAVNWMPTGDKIMYVWLDNGKATLNIADPDTKNWKEISELWETDDEIRVSPDGTAIAYYRTGNTDTANAINLTSPDGKLWKTLLKDGYNYGVLWSPDSEKFLFQKRESSTQNYQVWEYDMTNGQATNLGIFTTLDKVVWSLDSQYVYAAVPLSGVAGGAGLTMDEFVKINPADGTKTEFKSDSVNIDGRDLFLSLAGDKIFFKNYQDGALYYLDLNK